MFLIFVFFISLMTASSDQLVGFAVDQKQYVDCHKWLDQVAAQPHFFPDRYMINVDGLSPLVNVLQLGMHDKALWPTRLEPESIALLKRHAVYEQNSLAQTEMKSWAKQPSTVLFVCFITSLQLNKFTNRLQLETGHRIAKSNGNLLDESFKELKEDDFSRVTSEKFYNVIANDGQRFFGGHVSEGLLKVIKDCDSRFTDIPSSIEYEKTLLMVLGNCLLRINELLIDHQNHKKSKL
jgi:hypothetical protein